MHNSLLTRTLADPIRAKKYSSREWGLLLSQARVSKTSLYLLSILEKKGLSSLIPQKVKIYLTNEKYRVEYLKRQVALELKIIDNALAREKIAVTYLKGAAYLIANMENSRFRVFSDIDILVNKGDISATEKALKARGFISQKTDDYDQRYYRQYMHEIPPMQHVSRGTVLDVHHNVLPITSKNPIDVELLAENTQLGVLGAKCSVFSDEAMYLHAAIHLFHEGEFDKGLRDLCDLATMYDEFSRNNIKFDEKVIYLARNTKQEKSLYFALHYIALILNITLGQTAQDYVKAYRKSYKLSYLADFIFFRVLLPNHYLCDTSSTRLAKFFAYIRGHMLRMPLRLLIPHLLKKAWMQLQQNNSSKATDKEKPNL